jgi:hypothetical protein
MELGKISHNRPALCLDRVDEGKLEHIPQFQTA